VYERRHRKTLVWTGRDTAGVAATAARRSFSDVVATDAVVRTSDLTRRFDGVTAVEGLDLEVEPGTVLGVVGPSGSGKTTTIRMLMGSLAPTRGEVSVLGESPRSFRPRTRERIGYMPQHFILYPDLTVRENVDFVASLYGLFLLRRRRRTRAVLELLGLWNIRDRRATKLSGGEQRRLELAAALVHEPALLILDEPTAGVDPILRRTIWDEIHRLRDRGVTAIVTTQYVTEAEEVDRVAVIARGHLVALDSPAGLRRQAMGGEIIEVETGATFDAAGLSEKRGIRDVHQTGLRSFRAVVDDAGEQTPEVVEAVRSAGGEVASVREVKPTFEEIFAAIVERPPDEAPPEQVVQSAPQSPPQDVAAA
jgi:ABC-2 type transport system ATP-binding protein